MCEIESLLELPYWVSFYHNGLGLPKNQQEMIRIQGLCGCQRACFFSRIRDSNLNSHLLGEKRQMRKKKRKRRR